MIIRLPKRKRQDDISERQLCITQRLGQNTFKRTVITFKLQQSPKLNLHTPKLPSEDKPKQATSQPKTLRTRKSIKEQLFDSNDKSVSLNPHQLLQTQYKFNQRINKNIRNALKNRYGSVDYDNSYINEYAPQSLTQRTLIHTIEPHIQNQYKQLLPRISNHQRGSSLQSMVNSHHPHKQQAFCEQQPRNGFQPRVKFDILCLSSSMWKFK